ncbi:fructose PTS transporter subunit IIA [Williamsoniiplasma luminosum]|uniref:Uncharacterized protein n=1 Tax=Williamsoniiplasma luminosum TaxID=214888 RepID=A0A2S0NJ01_9MOLU|nr:fructose PTS transporter subunit IIA [Williamsoniiplasma luminosum]AVP48997.1 MAG: hypothetical protein C5T88_00110 [Williamsoniiplasma luminosum]
MVDKILKKEYIFLDIDLKNADEVFDFIAKTAKENDICDNVLGLIEKLKEREKLSSTGFESGFAIPHTQYEAIKKNAIFFIRLKEGVEWLSMDGQPSRLFFCILVGTNNNGEEHITILGQIASKLMDQNFITNIQNASSKDGVLELFDSQNELETQQNNDTKNQDFYVAISACTFGLAHTYLAEQKLLNYAKEHNFEIKIETHGSQGDKNIITPEDLKRAKGVLIAVDKEINLKHIKHENIYSVRTIDAIKNTKHCFDVLNGEIHRNKTKEQINFFFKVRLQQVSNKSVQLTYNIFRYMALIIGILALISTYLSDTNKINDFINVLSYSRFAVEPIFAYFLIKYLTKSETSAGSISIIIFAMNIYSNFIQKNNYAYGIIGVVFLLIIVYFWNKYIYVLNQKVIKDKKIQGGTKWLLQILIVIISLFIVYYTYDWFGKLNDSILLSIMEYDQKHWWFRMIIASVFLFMMTIDMGGPINKWTIIISAILMFESFAINPTKPWLTPITAQVLGITMPGLSLWVRGKILSNKLTENEKASCLNAGKQAYNGISEGAIWSIKEYGWKTHLNNLILAIYCGAVIGLLNIQTYGGYNMFLGAIFGFSTDNIFQLFNLDFKSFNIGFLVLTTTAPIFGGLLSVLTMQPKK